MVAGGHAAAGAIGRCCRHTIPAGEYGLGVVVCFDSLQPVQVAAPVELLPSEAVRCANRLEDIEIEGIMIEAWPAPHKAA